MKLCNGFSFGWVKRTSHICICYSPSSSSMDNLPQAAYNVCRREIIQDSKWCIIISPRVEFMLQNARKTYRLKVYFRFVKWNLMLYMVSILDQSIKYMAFSYPTSYKSLLLVNSLHSQCVHWQLFSFCIMLVLQPTPEDGVTEVLVNNTSLGVE